MQMNLIALCARGQRMPIEVLAAGGSADDMLRMGKDVADFLVLLVLGQLREVVLHMGVRWKGCPVVLIALTPGDTHGGRYEG